MRIARIGVLVVLVAGAAAFAGVGLPEGAKGLADQTPRGITVTGTGKATTVPDQAGFWFGVETRRKTASDASAVNNREMQKLIAALEDAGVREADIQTADISVSPVYSESGSDVVGYVASNSVSVTVSLKDAAAVLDAAVGAGANQVTGPSLTRSDSDALYRSALKDAVADARSRAEVLAAAAGVGVGEVISIDEGSTSGPIMYDTRALTAEAAPIKAGTQDIEATVTVTYAIA
jgi:uncharacterized protein YggE